MEFYVLASLFLVAICWGFTNPFIQIGSLDLNKTLKQADSWNPIARPLIKVFYTLTHWKYSIPLCINLSGSTLYYYTLGEAELSLLVPICTCLTFAMTALGDILLKRFEASRQSISGVLLVMLGVSICIYSKS